MDAEQNDPFPHTPQAHGPAFSNTVATTVPAAPQSWTQGADLQIGGATGFHPTRRLERVSGRAGRIHTRSGGPQPKSKSGLKQPK